VSCPLTQIVPSTERGQLRHYATISDGRIVNMMSTTRVEENGNDGNSATSSRACSPALESLSRARLYARIVSKVAARSGQPQKLPNRLVSASAGYATAGPELFLRSWLSPV